MTSIRPIVLAAAVSVGAATLYAVTPAELESRFKPLPTVPESEMPELPNARSEFRGVLELDGLQGETWVTFPFVENPGSFALDPQGVMYVAEANRFWLGVPDLRGANEMIRDDFQSVTVEDRAKMYEKFASSFPEGWFNRVADRVIRLEDSDGNGAPDRRTVFSDRFNETLDGLGFSLLADDGSVYYTNIPHLWKLTDTTGDGVADQEEQLVSGFGVRVSFIGHDLHGIIRGPDGLLYFSIGDRGYHVTDDDGTVHAEGGKGAVFRCADDGSGFEVVCTGLRNPTELAFDDFGNLFTFDNTGDIGDKARMVYVLEGTDSGWDMSHQSAHQYATQLDWGEFRPEKSMWVAERMYDLHHEEQPQWVYPPAAHSGFGPSGITYLTGESLPEELRGKFLVSNYGGAVERSIGLLVDVTSSGAGYDIAEQKNLFKGVGVSDVELGYDGRLYICDFGGGWSVNENGSIQMLEASDSALRHNGDAVAALFRDGFEQRSVEELSGLLGHADRRVRQAAQFQLAGSGESGLSALIESSIEGETLQTRLHAIWGLGQAIRDGAELKTHLIALLKDEEAEVRANAARVLGDLREASARQPLLRILESDPSLRVQSLAAIALSRIAPRGDKAVTRALFYAAVKNGEEEKDIVLRHALLTGLDRVANDQALASKAGSDSTEGRLLSVLALRRHESERLSAFIAEKDPQVRQEVLRAIYETPLMDGPLGAVVAQESLAQLPLTMQRRVVAANYRLGTAESAQRLLAIAEDASLDLTTRRAALQGLQMWEASIETDPVMGHYRPLPGAPKRTMASLRKPLNQALRSFVSGDHDSELLTLAMELVTATGVQLDADVLEAQVLNTELGDDLRVAVLESLMQYDADALPQVINRLLDDSRARVRAAAMEQAFTTKLANIARRAQQAIAEDDLIVARAAIRGLNRMRPKLIADLWKNREKELRPGLQLDVYLALAARQDEDAAAYAAADPNHVFHLSLEGGDVAKGEFVFRNHGACLQCHKVGKDGGIQGPDLTQVHTRLSREKLLESLYNPGAEITEGYGMTTLTKKDGGMVIGRILAESDAEVTVLGLDNVETTVPRGEVTSVTPPVSAMPPLAATLPPADLRDLVAYLAAKKVGKKNARGGEAHGDEAIAK